MPEEVELQIREGSNPEFKNIYLKDLQGNGDYIIVQKDKYASAFELNKKTKNDSPMYSCKVKYKGQPASFLLFDEGEKEQYNEAGGVDDKVKITRKKEMYTDKKGVDRVKKSLTFEKVE